MSNHLANETSPYLLQHADNPVNWHPWNETALKRAREEGKPILLSVGYSACHWCHVMAHESFEDEETAAVMNENFINIKVDREERPDLDRIYQIAQQMLTQRNGGWPLTMFLTHDDHMPFFGGTYFPRDSRYGLPGFKDVLRQIAELYHRDQQSIRRQNESLRQALASMQSSASATADSLNPQPLSLAIQQLEQSYDNRHGGFGSAPKFPHPSHIETLLRYSIMENHQPAGEMALTTLRRMAEGGIYDQLGGGFCRYSVDAEWTIPHFEKMMYDNGPLLALYAEAWQISGDEFFKRVTEETVDWMLREMQSPTGGFYSSLDADSEGEEGKYYVWTPAEVHAALQEHPEGELLERIVTQHYGLDQPPNFEGKWHFRIHKPLSEIAADLNTSERDIRGMLDTARKLLFSVREQRVRPARDDKLLTSWNALAIRGLATAGRIMQRADWLDAAEQALDCICGHLWVKNRLLATHKDGRAHLNAYLDDHAFLTDAILMLLQARWQRKHLDFAIELTEHMLEHFSDPGGGFFFTSDYHESLIQRSKPLPDESLPNGNGIAARALQRLGHLLSEPRYLDAATDTLLAAWNDIERLPFAHGSLLLALEEHLYPPQLVIIRGQEPELHDWQKTALSGYQPRRQVIAIPAGETNLPGALKDMAAKNADPVAYICTGHACSAPLESLASLQATLRQPESATG